MAHSKQNDIDKIVFDILLKSKSLDIFPTPIDKIVDYCELNSYNESGFYNIPSNYVAKNIDNFKRMLKKVVGVLDRKEKIIYIDPSLPIPKKNFIKLHETGHGAIPWQKEIEYIDDEFTLEFKCKRAI